MFYRCGTVPRRTQALSGEPSIDGRTLPDTVTLNPTKHVVNRGESTLLSAPVSSPDTTTTVSVPTPLISVLTLTTREIPLAPSRLYVRSMRAMSVRKGLTSVGLIQCTPVNCSCSFFLGNEIYVQQNSLF